MLYRFPVKRNQFLDDFLESDAMSEYSDVVLIEGDAPLDYLHLSAFVARPLPEGEPLIVAGMRDTKAQREREIAQGEFLAEHPELLLELLSPDLRISVKSSIEQNPDILHRVGEDLRRAVGEQRSRPASKPTRCWTLAESHRGIEAAGLVIINIHDESERARAETMLNDVTRVRADKEIFDDVLGWRGDRIPVTAVVANLADPKDAGHKKAIARMKRAIAKGREG